MADRIGKEVAGDSTALSEVAVKSVDAIVPAVYEELRRIAHRQLLAEPGGHTLSTTAVVHEAYLRLAEQSHAEWADRSHFFAVAARMMRRVLVDYARRHNAVRRGRGELARISLAALEEVESPEIAVAERMEALLALDDALERLARMDERLARVVECRYFAGLTEEETASALGTSKRTVSRDWELAKGWLYQQLRNDNI